VRRRQEDLHGFDVLTALAFVERRVREAFENGYDEIEFQHGAADVRDPVREGRGRIKWALRDLVDGGRLDRWARPGGSWPKAASFVVALRPNPRRRSEHWSPSPYRAHRR
jgi:hypothetical protein